MAKAEQNKMTFSGAWHKISYVGFSVQEDKFEKALQLNSSGFQAQQNWIQFPKLANIKWAVQDKGSPGSLCEF